MHYIPWSTNKGIPYSIMHINRSKHLVSRSLKVFLVGMLKIELEDLVSASCNCTSMSSRHRLLLAAILSLCLICWRGWPTRLLRLEYRTMCMHVYGAPNFYTYPVQLLWRMCAGMHIKKFFCGIKGVYPEVPPQSASSANFPFHPWSTIRYQPFQHPFWSAVWYIVFVCAGVLTTTKLYGVSSEDWLRRGGTQPIPVGWRKRFSFHRSFDTVNIWHRSWLVPCSPSRG